MDPIPFAAPSALRSLAAEIAFADKGGTVVIEHGPRNRILLRQVLVDINISITESVTTENGPKVLSSLAQS
jgi:hypothetical protein